MRFIEKITFSAALMLSIAACGGRQTTSEADAESISESDVQNPAALERWQPGYLDIHCISTGMGNATYIIMPDGTTLLVDTGELMHNKAHRAPQLPDDSKGAGAWVADYISVFRPQTEDRIDKENYIDYAFITHYHDDHIGGPREGRPVHKEGGYVLSGITELGSIVRIDKLLDRGYTYPVDIDNSSEKSIQRLREDIRFYRDFVAWQEKQGMVHEIITPGSTSQIAMLYAPNDYPDFKVKVLFSAGKIVKDGNINSDSRATRSKFAPGEYPGENELSAGFRMHYGPFRFYTGGDIAGIGHTGGMEPSSMECAVAEIVGPVDVATLDHHGDRNSQNEKMVATLSPRVWLGFGWGVRHPGQETARRLSSRYIYPGDRDIYQTWMSPHCEAYLGSLKDYKSIHGHIVVRVAPGGKSYTVYVLEDDNTRRGIIMENHYETRKYEK